ncbi:hypothetical protein [Clostridium estertheticum]|uniref:hypothetical protein n=1 Tax=Clostridium estertheticum TaxID=238834 RepID=UPI001C7CCE4F|nr:hypothetical protein [Clostridium estertheticum]MBX4266308.1 hypothetical protein [Clostridium estertheticum]WLC90007.1 hypothetical protein KTC95_07400 [Clostridium estertheticum]
MIVTKKYLHNLRDKNLVSISEIAEKLILEAFGKDPEPDEEGRVHIYTEQDILENIRKFIRENA